MTIDYAICRNTKKTDCEGRATDHERVNYPEVKVTFKSSAINLITTGLNASYQLYSHKESETDVVQCRAPGLIPELRGYVLEPVSTVFPA